MHHTVSQTKAGTDKHWDSEVKGFVLFAGKKSKTWYYQKDVGGQTRRVLIGRFPVISPDCAGFCSGMGQGGGKKTQIGAPTLKVAMDAYLARPKLRSETHKLGVRQQFELHLKDWLRLPLNEITKAMGAASTSRYCKFITRSWLRCAD